MKKKKTLFTTGERFGTSKTQAFSSLNFVNEAFFVGLGSSRS